MKKLKMAIRGVNMRKIISGILFVMLFTGVSYADPQITSIQLDEAVAILDTTKLRIHFIDVGTGLAVFIQTPNNHKQIFIDGGKEETDKMVNYVGQFYPRELVIDLAIVTHADSDHFYGMMKVFDKYDVKEFWYSGYDSEDLTPNGFWKKNFLTNRIGAEAGCIIRSPLNSWKKAGDFVCIDGLDDIKILLLNTDSQPPQRDPVSNRRFDESLRRNNASLVFKLIYKDISFLFTGDINGRDLENSNNGKGLYECDSEELELVSRHLYSGPQFNLNTTVLQVPHHGGNGSSSMPFLNAINPEYAMISAGFDYGHPSEYALHRLSETGISESKIFRTDDGETESVEDEIFDDSFVFETDGITINRIFRVSM
ncbi:MAG: hypothetical protein KKE62_06090 [Proteobacteria bacterium]|nr:hypothetical protein [Pseudomonadota bacterium]MBU1542398.1 hypothetical protein [Pseudomonadota bacterium]